MAVWLIDNCDADLTPKEAGFVYDVGYCCWPLSEKQRKWLVRDLSLVRWRGRGMTDIPAIAHDYI